MENTTWSTEFYTVPQTLRDQFESIILGELPTGIRLSVVSMGISLSDRDNLIRITLNNESRQIGSVAYSISSMWRNESINNTLQEIFDIIDTYLPYRLLY